MSEDLLLVGSVPLETAEDVMTTFGPLADYLRTMPDGEVGDRRWWVTCLAYQVFNGHPQLETISRPTPENGVERLVPPDQVDTWQFKVKDGVELVQFGAPGWRLGYTRDAISSYYVFRKLREEGVLPQHVRFQISIPMVNSVIKPRTFPRPEDLDKVRPGFEAALGAELDKILEKIPHHDLAIQWDCCWEIADVYGNIPSFPRETAIERNKGHINRLSLRVPETVALGFHFCFGTFGGWPRFEPDDLGATVDFANACLSGSGRRVDWIHIPTLDRVDDDFFAPLARLKPEGARVYLGLIHNMERFEVRRAAAKKFLADFGLAAPCGFGRNKPSELPGIIQDHQQAMQMKTDTDSA